MTARACELTPVGLKAVLSAPVAVSKAATRRRACPLIDVKSPAT